VVERSMAPLLADHPDLDTILTARFREWRHRPLAPRTLREVGELLSGLQAFAPDVVLDLMGNHKAATVAALTMCDRRLGLSRRHRREPSSAIWINETVEPRGRHAVDHALSLLDGLGLPRQPPDFGGDRLLPIVPDEARSFLEERRDPFVLIHPGAGWGNKRYPPAWWGEVARRIEDSSGLSSLVASGPGEEELANRVVSAAEGAAGSCPAPSLPFLVALLRASRLVLAGDTGPLHLAHALGRPVLCLLGPTHPERSGPYGAPERALWKTLACSFCHKRYEETKACLLEISPESVAERAQTLLAETVPGTEPSPPNPRGLN